MALTFPFYVPVLLDPWEGVRDDRFELSALRVISLLKISTDIDTTRGAHTVAIATRPELINKNSAADV
jgi:hypothetical protein